MKVAENYIDFITIAKGFAIICVVTGHFTPEYMPDVYQHLKDFVYLFHMPLFMLIAGFLFENSITRCQGDMRIFPFIRKKFFRLMIPYLFLSFCIAALNAGLQQFMSVKVSVDKDYLYRIFYENVGGSATFLWFLYTLFIIFILAIFSIKIPKGRIMLFFIACILPFITLTPVLYLNSVGLFLFYFCSGQIFYKFVFRKIFLCRQFILVCLLVFIGFYIVRSIIDLYFIEISAKYLCGLSACIIILYISHGVSLKKSKISDILRCIGKYSSYIYLLHMMGVYVVRLIYERIGWHSYFSYTVFLILAVMIGCIFPILIAKFILQRNSILLFLMGESKKSSENLSIRKK